MRDNGDNKTVPVRFELELNRGWIYDDSNKGEPTGEHNFVISQEYFLSIFHELFPSEENSNDFLDSYEPETDGVRIYERAKQDGMIICEGDCNIGETLAGNGVVSCYKMAPVQTYNTLRLSWEQVCIYISNLLSVLLGRRIPCKVMTADGDYWSISAVNDRFTNSEIISLIDYVKGGKDMFRRNIPDDSNSSKSLDMDLCQALLSCAVHMKWEVELVAEDALWITGQFSSQVKIPELNQNLIHIDSKMVDCAKLISKDELIDRLFSAGGTYSALSDICQENFHKWQTPLYWTYPISDSLHNGCYFVLVKEGILVISYDEISEDEHEVFIRSSVRMCTAEEMSYFLDEWRQYSRELTASMEILHFYLCRLEGAA